MNRFDEMGVTELQEIEGGMVILGPYYFTQKIIEFVVPAVASKIVKLIVKK